MPSKVGVFILAVSMCFSGVLLSQTKETIGLDYRIIGVGIRSSVFQISEFSNKIIPPNRILLNVDPIKYIRLEGHFGIYSNERQVNYNVFPNGSALFTLRENSSLFGGGIFGVYPRENIKFIAGVRFSRNKYKQDNINSNATGTPYVIADYGEINIIAGILEAEYCFSKWFSIGADYGLVSMKDVFHPWDSSSPATTTTYITESNFLFRFYLY